MRIGFAKKKAGTELKDDMRQRVALAAGPCVSPAANSSTSGNGGSLSRQKPAGRSIQSSHLGRRSLGDQAALIKFNEIIGLTQNEWILVFEHDRMPSRQ